MKYISQSAYECHKRAECLWGEARAQLEDRIQQGQSDPLIDYGRQQALEHIWHRAEAMERRAKRLELREELLQEREGREAQLDRADLLASLHG